MLKAQYKKEMESIAPRSGFEEDTVALLTQGVAPQSKEENFMVSKISKRSKILIAIAAAAFFMVSTVFAAVALLRPDEVANTFGEASIAEAFRSDDAVAINQSIKSDDYTFTLMSIVSGRNLDDYELDADEERSYVVLAISKNDGTSFDPADSNPVMISPLVDGFEPWRLNIFSLDAYCLDTTADGVRYWLISTDSLECFADHRIRLAVYDGMVPSPEVFTIDDNGVIDYNEGYTGTRAMFDLPLDPAKADPAAAAALMEAYENDASGSESDGDAASLDDDMQSAAVEYLIQGENAGMIDSIDGITGDIVSKFTIEQADGVVVEKYIVRSDDGCHEYHIVADGE